MRSMTPAGVGGIPLPHFPKIPTSEMRNEHSDAPKQAGIHFSDEATAVNKQLLGKIDSKSISNASSIKGSIYFYSDVASEDNLGREELIHDPSALDAAINTLEIEIRHENKHHRWDAQLPHALKILEFASMHLGQHDATSTGHIGVNAELKWKDEKDLENIIHLVQHKHGDDWRVTKYA